MFFPIRRCKRTRSKANFVIKCPACSFDNKIAIKSQAIRRLIQALLHIKLILIIYKLFWCTYFYNIIMILILTLYSLTHNPRHHYLVMRARIFFLLLPIHWRFWHWQLICSYDEAARNARPCWRRRRTSPHSLCHVISLFESARAVQNPNGNFFLQHKSWWLTPKECKIKKYAWWIAGI